MEEATKRKARSAAVTPKLPASRSKANVYAAPGSTATISTATAMKVGGTGPACRTPPGR
jgi:hypothetical protein